MWFFLLEYKIAIAVATVNLASGATPVIETLGEYRCPSYGHELYVCPECMRLENNFNFKLALQTVEYEPDYECLNCRTLLRRVKSVCHDGHYTLIYKNNSKVDWKCPDCGKNKLISGEVLCGCWD